MSLLLVLGGFLSGCASIKPVTSVTCSGPATLNPNEAGTFNATVNDDATQPLEVRWDFADGNTASGLMATHSFERSGSYNVTVTASNQKSTDSAVCSVTVLEPPTCQIAASPASLSMCTQPLPTVSFRPSVTGSTPITYSWNFGDGGTSSQAQASHTYVRTDAEPATLTRRVTLSVSNPAGSGQCSTLVDIEPCPCNPNLVFAQACFERGEEAMLNDQARRNVQDNLEILRANPRIIVAALGFAQSNERGAEGLAGERARAVMKFYTDNGIDASRITPVGLIARERNKRGPVCAQTIPFCEASERDAYIEAQR